MGSFSQRKRSANSHGSKHQANDRGVRAIRRPINPESFEVFERVNEELEVEFRGSDRLFTPPTLMVTVVGFSRFSKKQKHKGPPTSEIIRAVPSYGTVIEAELGSLGIFGSGNGVKLGFDVNSADLEAEYWASRRAYSDRGFPIHDRPLAADDFRPHCSIGYLHSSNVGHHSESIRRYNRLVEDIIGSVVLLDPPKISG